MNNPQNAVLLKIKMTSQPRSWWTELLHGNGIVEVCIYQWNQTCSL